MISVSGLRKGYPASGGTVQAVAGIDLTVDEGAFCVLLGPSGCGKTTTLRCIAGLERPDEGEIRLGDRVLSAPDRGVFVPPEARGLGMVFQSYALWPHMTVFGNVALPLTAARPRPPRSEVRRRVLASLQLVQLEGYQDRPVTDLSGGQQQRAALARAIVAEPRVLLMDEPLSNLDAKLRERMRSDLRRLTSELGVTTVYVTHDQSEALSMADQVCVMNEGRILQQASPEEIYRSPANPFVADFVGQMNLLSGTLREPGVVAWQGGLVRCGPLADRPASTPVTLAIRPEHLAVGPADDHADLEGWASASGRVKSRLFAGDTTLWHIDLGGHEVVARSPGERTHRTGQTVRVSWRPEHWHVYDAAGVRLNRGSPPLGA